MSPVEAFWKLLLFCLTKIRIHPGQETALEQKTLAMESSCCQPLTKKSLIGSFFPLSLLIHTKSICLPEHLEE